MNDLENYLAAELMEPTEAMNLLQEHGVIADECVLAKDVAKADCQRAVQFLEMIASITPP